MTAIADTADIGGGHFEPFLKRNSCLDYGQLKLVFRLWGSTS
jgi:hypothetical protein